MWSISVTLFYLNYVMKDDLCRQFQSEALRLGLWHMNLVVPEAQFSQQHLHLDLRCRQIKTITYLLSIPAGFPTAFELRPVLTLPFSFVTPALSQGIFNSQLPVPYLTHSINLQCWSLCLRNISSFHLFLFNPEGDF